MSMVKNSTILIGGVMVSNLLAYAFHFIAGRMLGPESYGVFGALMALFLIVALPAYALGSAITKVTSRLYTDNKLGTIALFRKQIQKDILIFSGILVACIFIFSRLIADFLRIDSVVPVCIVAISIAFTLLLPVNRGMLQGMKKFKDLSWNAILEGVTRLALVVVFLYAGYGVNGALLAYGIAYLIAFLSIFPFIREIKDTDSIAEPTVMKPVYKFIVQVLFASIVIQSMINLPSIFIKHFFSSEFTGYWTAALTIARISMFTSTAISMVMFPELTGARDAESKKRIFYIALKLVLFTSTCMAVIFFAIPHFIIQVLYGSSFLGAAPILQWMGVAMIFIGILQLWSDYYLARLK